MTWRFEVDEGQQMFMEAFARSFEKLYTPNHAPARSSEFKNRLPYSVTDNRHLFAFLKTQFHLEA
jgi:hypothetical protein